MYLTIEERIERLQGNLNLYEKQPWYKERGNEFRKVYDYVERFDTGNVQGYFGLRNDKPERLDVQFSGSNESLDWLFNFLFKLVSPKEVKSKTPYERVNPAIKVHLGFLELYMLVRDQILRKAKDFKEIVCVGHSLGGALATLAAIDIQNNVQKDIACLPFSSPKVGNKEFVESFNRRIPNTWLYYYGDDTVVRMPPSLPFFPQYQHVGEVIEVPGAIRWLPTRWLTLLTSWPIDHYPDYLLDAMKKAYLPKT